MADINIQLILRLVDRATAPARAAMRAIERLGGEAVARQAERISRGGHMMASGLGTMTGAALRGGAVIAGYAGSMSLLAGAFLRPAAQFERFRVQLTNLEGSAEGADRALRWIEEFATRTPLQLDQTVAAYARLKAFGLDPTRGAMQALVDTMAATGGGAEQLDGLVLALGQAWTKGKLQGEEALQMLERGVPVWDLLAAKMGRNAAELQDLASKGKLGRREIELLIEALGEKNKGAADAMSRTWDGILSNIVDHWGRFQRMVMGSGLFQYLKDRLLDALDTLNAMAADGRLQLWADQVARAILQARQAIWAFGQGALAVWRRLVPVLSWAADLLGGWDRLAWFAASLVMGQTIIGLIGGFLRFGQGVLVAASGLAGLAVRAGMAVAGLLRLGAAATAPALAAAGTALRSIGMALLFVGRAALIGTLALGRFALGVAVQTLSGMATAIRAVGTALLFVGRVALANPLILILTAAAGLAVLIWQNFDTIKAKAEALFTYLTGWSFADVTAAITAAFDIDLFQMGVDLINSLWEGIKSVIGGLRAYVADQLSSMVPDWIRNMGGGGADAAGAMDGNPAVAGARATGGPVRAGEIYRWQEEGQELFVPRSDGAVIPARQVRALQATGRGGSFIVGGITIHAAPGQSPAEIARAVRRELAEAARTRGFALDDGAAYA